MLERTWEDLGLVKVYTKKRGAHPDLTDPICLRKGATIEVKKTTAVHEIYAAYTHVAVSRLFAMESIVLLPRISVMHSFGEFPSH